MARLVPTIQDKDHLQPRQGTEVISVNSSSVDFIDSSSSDDDGQMLFAGNMAAPHRVEARQRRAKACMADLQPQERTAISTSGGRQRVPTPVPQTAMPTAKARLLCKGRDGHHDDNEDETW